MTVNNRDEFSILRAEDHEDGFHFTLVLREIEKAEDGTESELSGFGETVVCLNREGHVHSAACAKELATAGDVLTKLTAQRTASRSKKPVPVIVDEKDRVIT